MTIPATLNTERFVHVLTRFRVMRSFGVSVLVFLEAQKKSTCISHNSFCLFYIKQCIIKQ